MHALDDRDAKAESRAQVGVGTLIVFVAAVLVAAATAGVLFHTVDVLETRSDATGSRVADELTSELSVVAVTGTVDQGLSPEAVDTVRIIVSGAESSGPVDLGEAQVDLRTPSGQSVLTASPSRAERGETFTVEALSDPDGSAPVVTSAEDRYALVLETDPLEPGERLTATVLLESGATQTVRVSIPTDLEGRSAVVIR